MELPDPVRQRLGNFSRTVFSDSNRTGPEYSEGPGEWPRLSAARGAARFCPDQRWRFRLQRVHRSAGGSLEEGLGLGLGLGPDIRGQIPRRSSADGAVASRANCKRGGRRGASLPQKIQEQNPPSHSASSPAPSEKAEKADFAFPLRHPPWHIMSRME